MTLGKLFNLSKHYLICEIEVNNTLWFLENIEIMHVKCLYFIAHSKSPIFVRHYEYRKSNPIICKMSTLNVEYQIKFSLTKILYLVAESFDTKF